MADATLMQHLFAIKQQLAADEIDTLMATVARSSEAEQLQFIDSVKALSVEGGRGVVPRACDGTPRAIDARCGNCHQPGGGVVDGANQKARGVG